MLFALAGLAVASGTEPPDPAAAKIRLLSEALHARDTGETAMARQKLQQLLELAPKDETVKRLLASLDRLAMKQVRVAGGTVRAPVPVAVSALEADQLARAEEERLA